MKESHNNNIENPEDLLEVYDEIDSVIEEISKRS